MKKLSPCHTPTDSGQLRLFFTSTCFFLLCVFAQGIAAQPDRIVFYWDQSIVLHEDPYLLMHRSKIMRYNITTGERTVLSASDGPYPYQFPGAFDSWWVGGKDVFLRDRLGNSQILYHNPTAGSGVELLHPEFRIDLLLRSGEHEFISATGRQDFSNGQPYQHFLHASTFHAKSYFPSTRVAIVMAQSYNENARIVLMSVGTGAQIEELTRLTALPFDSAFRGGDHREVLQRTGGGWFVRREHPTIDNAGGVIAVSPDGTQSVYWPTDESSVAGLRILDEQNGELLLRDTNSVFILGVDKTVRKRLTVPPDAKANYSDSAMALTERPVIASWDAEGYIFEIRATLFDENWNTTSSTRRYRLPADFTGELKGEGPPLPIVPGDPLFSYHLIDSGRRMNAGLFYDEHRNKLHLIGDFGTYEVDVETGDRLLLDSTPMYPISLTAAYSSTATPSNDNPPTPGQYVNYLTGFAPFPPDTNNHDRNEDGAINSGDVVRRVLEEDELPQ